MAVTDPVADFLTRIRNASRARHKRVDIPSSNLKKAMAEILVEQKFVANYSVLENGKQGLLRIQLKYQEGEPVLRGLRRASRPGLRQYRRFDQFPRVLGGLGITIVSTSKGVMTARRAALEKVGGEVLAYVW